MPRSWVITGLALALLLALLFAGQALLRSRQGSTTPAAPPPSLGEIEALVGERVGSRPEAGPAPAPPPDVASERRKVFGARLIDERGKPLSGGRLAWVEASTGAEPAEPIERRSAATDRSGVVWLLIEEDELPSGPLQLVASAPGRATARLSIEPERWRGDRPCSLGEITLLPATGRPP